MRLLEDRARELFNQFVRSMSRAAIKERRQNAIIANTSQESRPKPLVTVRYKYVLMPI